MGLWYVQVSVGMKKEKELCFDGGRGGNFISCDSVSMATASHAMMEELSNWVTSS